MATKPSTSALLAAALVNTKSIPPGVGALGQYARESRAYYACDPYPAFHFADWKTDERGPRPVCLPLVRSIVDRGAKWLFGKPVQVTSQGNEALEKFLADAWAHNRMDSRTVPMAKNAALDSGIVLKWAYDETKEEAERVRIQTLSLTTECRLFFDPHDATQILMGRVQYPYFDVTQGKHFLYREEWTAEKEIHYIPIEIGDVNRYSLDSSRDWIISTRQNNPFGRIPMRLVKNMESDDLWGNADFWTCTEGGKLFRLVDRINLSYHLMDRSNQFDSVINPIFVDLEMSQQDIDRPLQPGQPLAVESTSGNKGSVLFPPTGNNAVPNIADYIDRLKSSLYEAVSCSEVDADKVSNKGNLTSAVLEQLYQAQIEVTNEKRKSYGRDGISRFLSDMARGLQEAGVPGLGVTDDPETYSVEIKWPEFFEPTQDELGQKTNRTIQQIGARLLDPETGVEEVAHMERRRDVKTLKDNIGKMPDPEEDPGGSNTPANL